MMARVQNYFRLVPIHVLDDARLHLRWQLLGHVAPHDKPLQQAPAVRSHDDERGRQQARPEPHHQ